MKRNKQKKRKNWECGLENSDIYEQGENVWFRGNEKNFLALWENFSVIRRLFGWISFCGMEFCLSVQGFLDFRMSFPVTFMWMHEILVYFWSREIHWREWLNYLFLGNGWRRKFFCFGTKKIGGSENSEKAKLNSLGEYP